MCDFRSIKLQKRKKCEQTLGLDFSLSVLIFSRISKKKSTVGETEKNPKFREKRFRGTFSFPQTPTRKNQPHTLARQVLTLVETAGTFYMLQDCMQGNCL